MSCGCCRVRKANVFAPNFLSRGARLRPRWKKVRTERWRLGPTRKILRLAQKRFFKPWLTIVERDSIDCTESLNIFLSLVCLFFSLSFSSLLFLAFLQESNLGRSYRCNFRTNQISSGCRLPNSEERRCQTIQSLEQTSNLRAPKMQADSACNAQGNQTSILAKSLELGNVHIGLFCVRRVGVHACKLSCGRVLVKVRVCRCVCESACGRVTSLFFCLYSSCCVRTYVTQCALVVAVILKCSTFLAGISEYSTVSVVFLSLLFFPLCTGPGTHPLPSLECTHVST